MAKDLDSYINGEIEFKEIKGFVHDVKLDWDRLFEKLKKESGMLESDFKLGEYQYKEYKIGNRSSYLVFDDDYDY